MSLFLLLKPLERRRCSPPHQRACAFRVHYIISASTLS
jgi:hypothetical protein